MESMKAEAIRQSIKRHPKAWYYSLLTCAVTLAFLGASAFLLANGRELVWKSDALPLYTNFLVWAKEVLADALGAMASGTGFELPQYTYSMGYGSDVPVTMGSYLQDPINLIAFAMPKEWIGLSYSLMTYARMLLAALAFSWYCFARGHGRRATGIAALAYATCGFVVFLGVFRHPKFMDWAILLPLVLQGADRIFQKKSPWLLIGALVMQFCVSIYFSYMTCLVLLVYCLIKYFFTPRNRSVGDFALLVGRFAAFGILAFLISGLLSLPQIAALLSQGRATSGGTAVPLLFTIKYYAKIAAHFIGAAASPEGMVIGAVSTIGLLSFLVCGKRFKPDERRPWLIGFALCLVGIVIPFFGHVMNGMGYSSDRWMLITAFVCSYILCMTLERMALLERAEWKRIAIGVGVIAALTVIYGFAQVLTAEGLRGSIWPLCMAAVFVAVFVGIRKFFLDGRTLRAHVLAGFSVILCVSLSGIFYCSPIGENWISYFPKAGGTWNSLSKNTPGALAERLDDDGIWRYSLPRVYDSMKNSALVHGVMGIDYYTSYYNQYVDNFRQELGISDHHINFSFIGSDSRLAIEDLTGAKYYICKDYDAWRAAYGFTDTGTTYRKFEAYRNDGAMPLAFAVNRSISPDEYAGLSMVQKQEALLQGVVVDESALDTPLKKADLSFASQTIDFEIVDTDGMEIDGNSAKVYRKDASATIRFSGLPSSETYLVLENLGFTEYSPSTLAQLNGKPVTLKTRLSDLLWTKATMYPITAKSGERSNRTEPSTPDHRRHGRKVNWIFNLGYSDTPLTEMTIEFQEPGDYTFGAMRVACQPVEPIVSNARSLSDNALDDFEIHTNGMSATLNLDTDDPTIAVFTFAYTPGWSVKVDGQDAKALRVDTAFTGVEVSGAGKHSIELSYVTPGVSVGAVMTALGLAVVIVMLIARTLASRRKKQLQ